MEQMVIDLFNELIKKNEIWDAHTVGKNLYNKDLSNKELFAKYFNFVVAVSGYPIEIETRKYFINEAETALLFFSENVDMSDDALNLIIESRRKLINNANAIKDLELKHSVQQQDARINENNSSLSELVALKGKLYGAVSQEQFDKLLIEVSNIESSIHKESFTNDQKALYDSLTKEYSQIVSKKMTDLNRISCVEYNKTAMRDFKDAFNEFKANEEKYINSQSQLFNLVSKRLFSHDASLLFNETLIYYNHVYSYIFSKLDDDGKFWLTQISIDTERVSR